MIREIRLPEVNYREAGDHSCFSAAIAFVLHQVGCAPPFWRPLAVDTITGRMPGQPTQDYNRGFLFLLEQGLRLTEVRPDSGFDYSRYEREGDAYVLDHYDTYCARNPDIANTRLTAEELLAFKATVDQFAPYKDTGQYIEKNKTPTIEDIKTLSDDGLVIVYQKVEGCHDIPHSIVVTGHGLNPVLERPVVRYFDYIETPPLTGMSQSPFINTLLPELGIVGVSINN